jgi:PEP-CTERM motif-containing protein
MKIHRMKLVAAVAAILLFRASAFGGTIQATPAPVASGPGLGFANVAAVVTVQANNDNVPSANGTDGNLVVPLKRFDSANFIDIEFTVLASDGTTEYKVSEFVDNNTGSAWSSYRMVLGFGTGANFIISPLGDGLDFDFPNYDTPPTSGAFPTVLTPDEDQLVFTGGLHGGGAQPYNFRIDVPDLIGRQIPQFTLRQIPTANPIPEPSTLILASVAALGLVRRRRDG